MTVEHYPLHWPENWPRTPIEHRTWGNFSTSQNDAQNGLMREIELLGGQHVVLSTNVRLRKDGMPYTSDREPDDGGVAVYFSLNGNPMCFACDQYIKVKANMQAVRKTIEALRGIERWGASDMMQRAFSGFMQLPAPGQTTVRGWREVLGVPEGVNDLGYVKHMYRTKSGRAHPDKGGSEELQAELNRAWEQAQEALKNG
jgi:hypothetical protein